VAQTRKQVRRSQQAEAQARTAAARAAAAKAARRRRTLAVSGTVVAVVAIGAGVGIPLARHSGKTATDAHPSLTLRETLPPWSAPAHPIAAAKAAGLRVSSMETLAEHFHAHLDVIVNGKPAVVPGNLGIDTTTGQLSELHTHDSSGILHIEAPDKKHKYVLGQLFAEWDVRLDASHLGGLTVGNGKTLTAYVDGKRVSGDPAEIRLTKHEEIALVYGDRNAKTTIPKSYTFPQGD
jgi:hypothetical protein